MIWREKRVLLTVLGALLLANTLFFFTYRVQYQTRLNALDARLESAEGDLQQARHARNAAERTVRSYRKAEADVQSIFDEQWSTQSARLTTMIGEVKRLSVASGLVPPTYSFVQAEVKGATANGGSTSRTGRGPAVGATEVGVSFAVTGSYQQVRRLINLIELSRQFIIIEGITLSGSEGGNLSLNLQLKTLFRDDRTSGVAASRS